MTHKLRLAELDEATKALEAERQAILDAMAQEACPFVPGELIDFQSGRLRATGTVQKVFAKYSDFTMAVQRVRTNGAAGACVLVYSFDSPRKVEA